MSRVVYLLLVILTVTKNSFCFSQNNNTSSNKWVDSIYSSMNIDQKIGQLYSVWTASRYGQAEINEIKNIIDKYHIGGLIFSLGSINDQIISHNIFQEQSNTPLLISMDAEWGLGMRLEDGFSFPYNITLGAIRDDSLIFNVGQRIGEHLKKMGVHLNFAPVSDVNTNPKNPIIGARSFGENKFNVSKKSIKYIEGLNESGVLAVAKHFPGHGDTRKDSHLTLPALNYDSRRIEGQILSINDIKQTCELVSNLTIEEKLKHPCIGKRYELLDNGIYILKFLIEEIPIKEIIVTNKGLRHGMINDFFGL